MIAEWQILMISILEKPRKHVRVRYKSIAFHEEGYLIKKHYKQCKLLQGTDQIISELSGNIQIF